MFTCTWAPTVFQGPQLVDRRPGAMPRGEELRLTVADHVRRVEALGISHLLIAQRWWGNGEEIEGSSLDCLAMTSYIASVTERIKLVTAIHPGFFQPAALAKWAATVESLYPGRWAVNVTSGWNLEEFSMYGVDAIDHDGRYARATEFIQVLQGAWDTEKFSFRGRFYSVDQLALEPRPTHALEVFQGGQSPAARNMAAAHSDWMFLNGGRPEKLAQIITSVREQAARHRRQIRFAAYAAPLCRMTDDAAWKEIDARLERLDPVLVQKRRARVAGAEGMWAGENDPLSHLDTNEGYCTRLIGSPNTILNKISQLKTLGIDLFHLDLRDTLFNQAVLPHIHAL
ncbi:MAG: LLM class flavin-dependent oxidoreductase [Gammaproteobacteria bacterium]|nr:LLM class flavin-dependent oxidoreductase [Gammaproteobacteria bacterium]